jgi:hypothetical protein
VSVVDAKERSVAGEEDVREADLHSYSASPRDGERR